MVLASSYCGPSWSWLAITHYHLLIEDRWTWIIIEAWHYDKCPLSDTWNLYMLEPSCVLLWWYMRRGIVLQSAFHLMHTACFQFPSYFQKVPIKHGTKKKMTLGVQFLLSFVWKKHCRGLRDCGVILHCNRWALLTWWLQTAPASNFLKWICECPLSRAHACVISVLLLKDD